MSLYVILHLTFSPCHSSQIHSLSLSLISPYLAVYFVVPQSLSPHSPPEIRINTTLQGWLAENSKCYQTTALTMRTGGWSNVNVLMKCAHFRFFVIILYYTCTQLFVLTVSTTAVMVQCDGCGFETQGFCHDILEDNNYIWLFGG